MRAMLSSTFYEITHIGKMFFLLVFCSLMKKLFENEITQVYYYTAASAPIFTSILPKFSPLSNPINALGAFSNPSVIVSFHLIFPSLIHLIIDEQNSFCIS